LLLMSQKMTQRHVTVTFSQLVGLIRQTDRDRQTETYIQTVRQTEMY